MSDKDLLIARDMELEGTMPTFPLRKRTSIVQRIMRALSLVVLGCFTMHYVSSKVPVNVVEYLNVFAFFESAPVAPETIFEVQLPLNAVANFTSQLVLNDTFKDGLSGSFLVDDALVYDGAYFTLNYTTESVVSSPVVFEISVEEFPIWRTSVPATNTSVQISTDKNITKYLSLLEDEGLVSVKVLEGKVADANVTLELTLTNSGVDLAPVDVSLESLFSPVTPATDVYALGEGKVFNLPNKDKFAVQLPQLPQNATAAKLDVFASLSKEEISYFTSDDKPLRYINVFVNDIFVSTIAPKPALFHPESYSPDSLNTFEPLVDSGNLAGLSYEVDLVSVLPLLWASSSTLEIFVQGPQFDYLPGSFPFPKPVTKESNPITTEGWFVSGNLLSWESSAVNASAGALVLATSKELPMGFVTSPPALTPWQPTLRNLFAKDVIDSSISSSVEVMLQDGSFLNYTINVNSTTNSLVSKHDKSSKTKVGPPAGGSFVADNSSSTVIVNTNKVEIAFVNPVDNSTALTLEKKYSYPITLSTETKSPVVGPVQTTSKYGVDSKIKTKVNGTVASSESVKEKVSNGPLGQLVSIEYKNGDYKRTVDVQNGVIVKDSSK